jgi:hypothetical protein
MNKLFDLISSPQNKGAQVYLSMFDINMETVRDFGKYFFNPNANTWYNGTSFDYSKISPDSLEKE